MRFRLRTLMIVGLARLPAFQLLVFGAKYAGAPNLLVYAFALAAFVCLALPIVCGFVLVVSGT